MAAIALVVERILGKDEVTGSNPVSSTNHRSVAQWKSSGLRNQLSGVRISPDRPNIKYIMKFAFLHLPPLPTDLKNQIVEISNGVETRQEINPWLQNFHGAIPVASQEYGNQRTQMPTDIVLKIISLYQKYLPEDFLPILAVTDNVSTVPSHTPPHCDKTRQTAINYLLTTGGERVTTTIYQQTRQSDDLNLADHLRYQQVTVEQQHVLPIDRWHAFDVQTFHSVENITGRRCILSLVLKSNPDFQEFVNRYPTLIQLNNSGVLKTG